MSLVPSICFSPSPAWTCWNVWTLTSVFGMRLNLELGRVGIVCQGRRYKVKVKQWWNVFRHYKVVDIRAWLAECNKITMKHEKQSKFCVFVCNQGHLQSILWSCVRGWSSLIYEEVSCWETKTTDLQSHTMYVNICKQPYWWWPVLLDPVMATIW